MKLRQTGAALLAAMLTVALVASMAAAALWQQWRSVEVETAERARVQSLWVLTGALDWARLILREDARSGGADHLGEPWAVPLEEARLSTFLAAEKGVATNTTDAATQAFLSGYISDLQGRMNVLNLVENGKPSDPTVRAFAKLFEKLGLPRSELGALTENLRFAQDTSPNNGSARMAPLMPQRVGQLAWLGVSPRTLAILRPFITLLPMRTPVQRTRHPSHWHKPPAGPRSAAPPAACPKWLPSWQPLLLPPRAASPSTPPACATPPAPGGPPPRA